MKPEVGSPEERNIPASETEVSSPPHTHTHTCRAESKLTRQMSTVLITVPDMRNAELILLSSRYVIIDMASVKMELLI
jgi:hypothetical protein